MTFKDFLNEASNFVEVNGIRVVPNSSINATIFTYDQVDRTDGKGRYKKGTPKDTEQERFRDEYSIEIVDFEKSDFPFLYNYKSKSTSKVKILSDGDNFDLVSTPKMIKDSVGLYFFNDNIIIYIHKDDVEKFEKLATREESEVFKVTGFGN